MAEENKGSAWKVMKTTWLVILAIILGIIILFGVTCVACTSCCTGLAVIGQQSQEQMEKDRAKRQSEVPDAGATPETQEQMEKNRKRIFP